MDKYISKNGLVGVLVSRSYLVEWSGGSEFLAMDKTLVEMKINGFSAHEAFYYLTTKGLDDQCMYAWDKCEVEYLPKGTVFKIVMRNDFEEIETIESFKFTA